jgi:hypothetical protein
MREKFRDADKAASYLSSGLNKDFPDAVAEVIHMVKKRPKRTTCEVREIGPILQTMCKDFPMASVDYHPENSYGFVAEVMSHGEKSNSVFKKRKRDRSRIIVLLTRISGQDVIVGSRVVPQDDEPAIS